MIKRTILLGLPAIAGLVLAFAVISPAATTDTNAALFAELEQSSMWKTYAKQNPAESARVKGYWLDDTAKPAVATHFGVFLVEVAEDREAPPPVTTTEPPVTTTTPPPVSDAPARANTVNCAGGSVAATSVANDTRYIDCTFSGDMNLAMNGKQRITIIGNQIPVSQLRGVRDIWIEGRPGAYMNAGPRSDGGDLLQIKRFPVSTGQVPEDVTLRWIRFHDVTRPGSQHPDGVQLMSGRRIRFLEIRMERVDIQPIFINDAGDAAGGGPLEDILVADSYIEKPPNGFYTVTIGSEVLRGIVRNTRVGSNVRLGVGAQANGSKVEGLMNLSGSPCVCFIVG